MECYLMTGQQDYLLRVVVSDPADFERLHSQHLTRLPGVARVAVELCAANRAQEHRVAGCRPECGCPRRIMTGAAATRRAPR